MTSVEKIIYQVFKFSDLFAMFVAFFALTSYEVAGSSGYSIFDFLSIRLSITNVVEFFILCLLYLFVFFQFNLYKPKFMPQYFIRDFLDISKAVGLNTLLLTTVGTLSKIALFNTINMLIVFLPSAIVLTLAFRFIIWNLLKRVHLGDKNHRNILIVGTNSDAVYYGKMVEEAKDLGYHFLGYLDDEIIDPEASAKHIGKVADFSQLLDDFMIDEIIICTTVGVGFQMAEPIILQAHAQGIIVRLPLQKVFKSLFKEADILRISCDRAIIGVGGETIPELLVHSGFQIGWNFVVKRCFDMLVAVIVLLITSPVLLISALIIRLTSPGDALFLQKRRGYNGRVFEVYKFRSMVANADAMQNSLRDSTANDRKGEPTFKMDNDPRITKIGKFIRKTSIDELPQLINVLKGDMSLVGPRPLPLADYARFKEISHLRRLSVLPGITGSWQVSGRNELSFEEWMKLDLQYIDDWSFREDLKILLQTIPAVLKGSGAS